MSQAVSREAVLRLISVIAKCGDSGKSVLAYARTIKDPTERLAYYAEAARHFGVYIPEAGRYERLPVDIRTFVESADFLNQRGTIYPAIMPELVELNSGKYVEAVLTGAIGTGKTSVALYTTAYQLYLLSCLRSPHAMFNLDPASEIVFIFQSLSSSLAKTVDYQRFRAMLDQSPYFNEVFPYQKDFLSELRFPKRLIVKPVSGAATAAIGQNVIGGLIDEVNFMQIIEASKQVADGGIFDQAMELYKSIVQRRKSRFMIGGKLYGMLCLVSSKRFPGEFTEMKAKEAERQLKETGHTDIFVYDKTTWDVKPPGTFSGQWFCVFRGDTSRRPRILQPDERVESKDSHLVLRVPMEFKPEFERDILSALRDVGGVSTQALNPFLINVDAVAACFGKAPSILSRTETDFVGMQLQIYPKRFERQDEPRFVHLDLSITGDTCGVAMGWVPGFVEMERRVEGKGYTEVLPKIRFDFTLEVKPPRGDEIQFSNVRGLIYKLRELGLNIKWVTADTFQSVDMLQLLAQQGFTTGVQSMDTDTRAYDVLKTAIYDGRVEAPEHERVLTELVRLERDEKLQKIDHPANFSKDVADCMAGVTFGLSLRREIWHRYNIPVVKIPQSLLTKESTGRASISRKENSTREAIATYKAQHVYKDQGDGVVRIPQ